jgi:RNA 2',3'-cyclic 3'-phosphodiesterase
MPRLFVAIPTPVSLIESLKQSQQQIILKLEASGTKKFRIENLESSHCTLRFLGETQEATIPILTEELTKGLSGQNSLSVSLGPLGTFPPRGPMRVIWRGLEPVEQLRKLKREIDNAVAAAGIAADEDQKRFTPHLTLIRFREPARRVDPGAPIESATAQCDEVVLFQSQLTSSGAIHSRREVFKLI